MTIKKILYIISIVTSFYSCNKIDSKELTIIEDVKLGQSYTLFSKQLDSLGVKSVVFYSKSIFTSFEEIQNYQFKAYVTELFDLQRFGNNRLHHYGIFYPETIIGTNNVVGLNVIIGHTGNAFLIDEAFNNMNISEQNNIFKFNQIVASPLVYEIKQMLISKYGSPIYEERRIEDFVSFFIEGTKINSFTGDKDIKGAISKWETPYLEIELFEGLNSGNVKFSKFGYEEVPGKKMLWPKDLNEGDRFCETHTCIRYRLKQNTIEKLGLDNKKL